MNQAEFARSHGVSRKTVTAWKNKDWVVLNADGTVDVEESNNNLKRNRSGKYQDDETVTQTVTQSVTQGNKVTARVTKQGSKKSNQGNTSSEGNKLLDEDENTTEIGDLPRKEVDRLLQIEKFKVEKEKAKLAKFETDIREGVLLLASDVAQHDAEIGSQLKKKLMSLPSELAVRIAAMNSPAEVESLLRAELTDALNEFLDAYGTNDT